MNGYVIGIYVILKYSCGEFELVVVIVYMVFLVFVFDDIIVLVVDMIFLFLLDFNFCYENYFSVMEV